MTARDDTGHPYPPGGPPPLSAGRHSATPLPQAPFVSRAALRRQLDAQIVTAGRTNRRRAVLARTAYSIGAVVLVSSVFLYLAGLAGVALLLASATVALALLSAGVNDGRLW